MQFASKKSRTVIALAIVIIGGLVVIGLPLLPGLQEPRGYPIAAADSITSWNWNAPATDAERKSGLAKVAALKQGLGKGSDYDAYIGIGSEYDRLGDGRNAYRYFSKAAALNPARGEAYLDLGHLMEELGALSTARNAYDAAVKAEPGNPVYRTAQDGFRARYSLSQKP
jgi:tetratricopeptide (TPR) repeat protein